VLTPWRSQVKGLLAAWYPGEQGGAAVARVLFGEVNPIGHLPVTFPRYASDEPTAGDLGSYPGIGISETYKEGVFVGYRWFDAHKLTPAFPFGFGLSYSRFTYSGLGVSPTGGGAVVSATVTNRGPRDGAAVPQLYLALPSLGGVPQPPLQLKGFTKVTLRARRSARVRFPIDLRALSYWDTAAGGWHVLPGCYGVFVGNSSRELALSGVLPVRGARCSGPHAPEYLTHRSRRHR
jgi:beta-glucosidase